MSRPWVAEIEGLELRVLRARNEPHGWDVSGGLIRSILLSGPVVASTD